MKFPFTISISVVLECPDIGDTKQTNEDLLSSVEFTRAALVGEVEDLLNRFGLDSKVSCSPSSAKLANEQAKTSTFSRFCAVFENGVVAKNWLVPSAQLYLDLYNRKSSKHGDMEEKMREYKSGNEALGDFCYLFGFIETGVVYFNAQRQVIIDEYGTQPNDLEDLMTDGLISFAININNNTYYDKSVCGWLPITD